MSHQRRKTVVPNLSDPGLTQMAMQMMQNPEMARMMQDPRVVQTAMRMVQQQQQQQQHPRMPPLHQQMAGLHLAPQPQPMMMPPQPMYMPQQPFMPMMQPAPVPAPRKSRSRTAIQQEAAERRKQKKAEKEQRKAAKKAAKRRSQDSDEEDEDEDELDISQSTEVYGMWNRMLISMIDKVIEARPGDKFALDKAREFIVRLADSKDADLRKQPLNELYDHLLPHHELVKNHDVALFDPELEALGGLSALGLHKHLATLSAEQLAELWKGIELLFLLAVQIKSANSSLLKIIEATLIKAKHSTEEAMENDAVSDSADAAAAGPTSFKDSINSILQSGGAGSGPLSAILGPMVGGAQDLESLVSQLPADVQAQVNTIVSQVEGGGENAAAASSSGTGDLFGSFGSDAILALLRSNTIIPKTKKK
ncbi:hypothetical protein [Medusavirus stheno T3]|uniref:Uncharacterized protein n=1 Tax=Medusavirus stheno T3 TaxID=3069717 RepID=A0A7S8BEK9_9VIRU|nr:hypothetical protein QKU73_gp368 [Acanthamoeba castellanii medusavirus]QPB44407.1 hypothetical protein [Medusavirus stheno T3]